MDDDLDGCDLEFDDFDVTRDDDIDALVLFADVDFTDEGAVVARVAEYEELARA
jgi:hypothetical protein